MKKAVCTKTKNYCLFSSVIWLEYKVFVGGMARDLARKVGRTKAIKNMEVSS